MARILSGIRPTGSLHLGNYLGVIRQLVDLQTQENQCFYFVADLHALTTIQKHSVKEQSLSVARGYLACGVDPKHSLLYKQSDIPAIPYFATLLSMLAPEAWLRRCTTFKDKSAKQQVVSLGLLAYPVLMAADILIGSAEIVPVGEDQKQHLEMTRDLANRFNHRFGELLRLPQGQDIKALRVPGLDGLGKMGKSEGNAVGIFESEETIRRKVMTAVTDSGPQKDSMSAPIKNLYYLLELCSPAEVYQDFLDRYQRGEQRFYGELKKRLAEDIIIMTSPLREKYHSKDCSVDVAQDILNDSAKKFRTIADAMLNDVIQKIEL